MNKKINDYHIELIKSIQLKNNQKNYLLLKKDFEYLLFKLAHQFYSQFHSIPFEFQDLLIYLEMFFFDLTKKYNVTSKKTFGSYIKEFLIFRMTTLLKNFINKNHKIMNYAVLDDLISFPEKIESEILEEKRDFLTKINNSNFLSKLDKKIISLIDNGKTVKEIAKELKKSKRSIYTLLYRMRKKLFDHYVN